MKALIPLTNKERKAIEREVNKQTAENVKNLSYNLQALILCNLREQLGWGKKRLLRFQKAFLPKLKELEKFYLCENPAELEFVCVYKLKNEVGIDVKELGEMFEFVITKD